MVSLVARENISAFDEILVGNYIPAAHRKIWQLGFKIGQSMRVLGRCDRDFKLQQSGSRPLPHWEGWAAASGLATGKHLSMSLVKSCPQGQISNFREMCGIVSILGKFSSIQKYYGVLMAELWAYNTLIYA